MMTILGDGSQAACVWHVFVHCNAECIVTAVRFTGAAGAQVSSLIPVPSL